MLSSLRLGSARLFHSTPRRLLEHSSKGMLDAPSGEMLKNLKELELKGYTVVADVFTPSQIDLLKTDYAKIKTRAYDIMASTTPHDRVWVESNVETRSRYWKCPGALILQAGEGRFDLYKGFNDGIFSSPAVKSNEKLGRLVDSLLVGDYGSYNGVIHSTAGSGRQYWHRDTDTLSNTDTSGSRLVAVDDFYFTCLIPITVPLTLQNGATEFLVGSHRRDASKFHLLEKERAEVPLGSALLFNGKINHRGMDNNTKEDRPVIYKVYHKMWYNDQFRKGVDETGI